MEEGKLIENGGVPKFDITDLNLHYGTFHALKGINMKIRKNEITAFIGPSGCGKSTFLKTLNRMNDLVDNVKIEGGVKLDGKDIFKEMDAITLRHRVGMVFQQPNPFPKSVYDNVAYGPRIFGIHRNALYATTYLLYDGYLFRCGRNGRLFRKNNILIQDFIGRICSGEKLL